MVVDAFHEWAIEAISIAAPTRFSAKVGSEAQPISTGCANV